MSRIRYDGATYALPDPGGSYLCDGIRAAIQQGHTFFVDFGADTEDPEASHLMLFGPNIACDLVSSHLPRETYRHDLVDAMVEIAAEGLIPFSLTSQDADGVAEVMTLFRNGRDGDRVARGSATEEEAGTSS